MTLYHISENSNISEFHPRPIQNGSCGLEGNAVWAVDEIHLANYLLPRDCPRVTFAISNTTTEEDKKRYFGSTYANRIIAIESSWLKNVLSRTLYRYDFCDESFTLIDITAGYYISRKSIKPEKVTVITNVLETLLTFNIELQIMPLLWKLRENIIKSSLDYSIIRMRNATIPPEGISSFHPIQQ